MIPGFRVGVALLAAALPGLSRAEPAPPTLDPVVVTGSRVEHSSFDLPVSVDVVDAARIGAIGFSMGANAILYALARTDALRAAIAVQPMTMTTYSEGYAADLLGPMAAVADG